MTVTEAAGPAQSSASADAALWRRFAGAPGDDVKASPVYRLKISGPTPEGFGLHMRQIVPPDVLRGEALLADVWRIGGERLQMPSGAPPWTIAAPSRHYADRIHRFDWLRDLYSQGDAGGDRARSLVDAWIAEFGKFHGFAWRLGPTADRAWNWMLCGADLFEVGDDALRRDRIDALARQIRHVEAGAGAFPDPGVRWRAACLSVAAEIALRGAKGLDSAIQRLDDECTAQILADGGHATRSPQRLLDALADLLTLADLFERAGRTIPGFVEKWIGRMGTMLGFFVLSDGRLAPFHDGGEGRAETVAAVLDRLPAPPRRFSFAMKSAYQKLEKDGLLVILDAGGAPDTPFADAAHCAPLAFHLSDGAQRLITSCGYSADVNLDWQAAVRRTAAHSALVLAGRDAAPFHNSDDSRLLHPVGPDGVTAKRLEETDHIWIDSQHAGWRSKYGLLHRRRLFLAGDGSRLTGEDSLVRPVSQGLSDRDGLISFDLRFHLHPDVTALMAGDVIKLTSAEGQNWRFKTSHPGAKLERSIYLGRGRVERTEQIVLSGQADPNGDGAAPPNCVRWAVLRGV